MIIIFTCLVSLASVASAGDVITLPVEQRKLLKELRDGDVIVIDAENSSMTDVSGDSGLGASEEIDRLTISHHQHQLQRHQPSTPGITPCLLPFYGFWTKAKMVECSIWN